jgi:O-antigen/teichoic acid export membrane protein
LLATDDPAIAYWVAGITFSLVFPMFFPHVLQGQKRFVASVVADNALYVFRLVGTFALFVAGTLTLGGALGSYLLGSFASLVAGMAFLGVGFLKTHPNRETYTKLLAFSGWLGANSIVSAVAGRLDVTMLASISGAQDTGFYSIASRLASFIVVSAASFSAVLATRLASFNDREREKTYILKASLALVPMVMGILLWIALAEPFVLLLFGDKYQSSVPVFRALSLSMIPFLLTVPSVSAIIFAIKKPIYIGSYAFFQLAAVYILNTIFIPKYGTLGPTYTFAITNSFLALYSWAIVIKYYWLKGYNLK